MHFAAVLNVLLRGSLPATMELDGFLAVCLPLKESSVGVATTTTRTVCLLDNLLHGDSPTCVKKTAAELCLNLYRREFLLAQVIVTNWIQQQCTDETTRIWQQMLVSSDFYSGSSRRRAILSKTNAPSECSMKSSRCCAAKSVEHTHLPSTLNHTYNARTTQQLLVTLEPLRKEG